MAARIDNGDEDGSELHDINVTPFIDVMLVLLIIFMVAAPLSTVDVAVDLPVSTAKAQPRPDKPLFLTIKADLSLAIGNDPILRGQLAQTIDAATEADRQKRIFLRADKTVPYGELMIVMNLLRAAGYLKLALVGLEGAEAGASPAAAQAPAPAANPPSPDATAQPPRPRCSAATSSSRLGPTYYAGQARPHSCSPRTSAAPRWRSCTGRRMHRMIPQRASSWSRWSRRRSSRGSTRPMSPTVRSWKRPN